MIVDYIGSADTTVSCLCKGGMQKDVEPLKHYKLRVYEDSPDLFQEHFV